MSKITKTWKVTNIARLLIGIFGKPIYSSENIIQHTQEETIKQHSEKCFQYTLNCTMHTKELKVNLLSFSPHYSIYKLKLRICISKYNETLISPKFS